MLESWAKVRGIISGMTDRLVYIRVDSIANFIVEAMHAKANDLERTDVHLVKSSESVLLSRGLFSLQKRRNALQSMRKNPDVELSPVAEQMTISSKLNPDSLANQKDHEGIRTSFPSLNQSQIEAVANTFIESSPISIIHGPPGTSKAICFIILIFKYILML